MMEDGFIRGAIWAYSVVIGQRTAGADGTEVLADDDMWAWQGGQSSTRRRLLTRTL